MFNRTIVQINKIKEWKRNLNKRDWGLKSPVIKSRRKDYFVKFLTFTEEIMTKSSVVFKDIHHKSEVKIYKRLKILLRKSLGKFSHKHFKVLQLKIQ